MAKEKIQPVHINYLTSKPGFSLLREMIKYASDYLGIDQKDLLASIRGITTDNPLQTGKLINDKFQFGSEEQALQHFITAQKTSRGVIKDTIKTFNLPPDRFGLKNEVDIPDPEISRMLLYTNSGASLILPKGTILRTRFEQLRDFLLTDISLRLDKRAVEEKAYDKMSQLQLKFNQFLFYGSAGNSELITYYVSFNEEHKIKNIFQDDFKGTTRIEEDMRVIEVEDGKKIRVQVNFSKKPSQRQIIKGLVEYIGINVNEYDPVGLDTDGEPALQDRQRFMFVVDGDDNDITIVHSKVLTFFKDVKEIPIHNNNGQNPNLKKRYIATYNGIPMEIIYYDFKGYINSQWHVGNKNRIGLYDGSAHELFEIRRSLPSLLYFFPFEVYGKKNQTEKEYAKEMMDFARAKSEETAKNIRGIN